MNRNLKWKVLGIVILVALAGYEIAKNSFKLGIDLAGGTTLLFEIDTSDMSESAKSEAAETTIRVLRERIDPGNQMNLIWRPQGTSRIEIQMPSASAETRNRRMEYQRLRETIESRNISRREVEAALLRQEGETTQEAYEAGRTARFAALTDDAGRLAQLEALGAAYDAVQGAAALLSDSLEDMRAVQGLLAAAAISANDIDARSTVWDNVDDPCRVALLDVLAGDDAAKRSLVERYVAVRRLVSERRNALDGGAIPANSAEALAVEESTVGGFQGALDAAWREFDQGNIDLERLTRFLEQGGTILSDEINVLKNQHADLASTLDELAVAYAAYAENKGQLDDPADLMRKLRGSGVLEFRILPVVGSSEFRESDAAHYRGMLAEYGPMPARYVNEDYSWHRIRDLEDFRDGMRGTNVVIDEFAGSGYVLASNKAGETMLESDGDWQLTDARQGIDYRSGGLAVDFEFNEIGAGLFLDLTRNNMQRQLCILLDDQAFSAPTIQKAIHYQGQITGDFSRQEIRDLVDKLNAGSLPARLGDQPISMNSVGPMMGQENIDAGLTAALSGLIAVALFMLLYYLVAGALADIALFMNLLIILGVMAFSRSTFTMPGIAGLILTIGMAVDANVLIFERIREEQERGSSLRMAIKNGYDRAFRTILDANVTTFITALILYMLASEEVKGFALTLMIGIVTSMFTALFVTRVIFDLLTEFKILKNRLVMMRLIRTSKINWMGARKLFWVVSGALVICGIGMFVHRHDNRAENSPYSIEFTGGTSVRVLLTDDSMDREAVEQAINDTEVTGAGGRSTLNARVQRIGAPEEHQFEIVTTATNLTRVEIPRDVLGGISAAELQSRVSDSAAKLGDDRMADVEVTESGGNYTLLTSQNSPARVRSALRGVLPADWELSAEAIQTDDIVSDTIHTALMGHLTTPSDLEPTLHYDPITEDLLRTKPNIDQSYLGGVLVTANFGDGQSESLARVMDRFTAMRLQDNARVGGLNYEVFGLDGSTNEEALVTGVEIAVAPEEVIYNVNADTDDMRTWTAFAESQTELFGQALSEEKTLPWVTQIDPSVGQQSLNDALVAIVFSLLAIVVYVWIRFGTARFGLAAVAALVHDVCIAAGMVAASAWLSQTAVGRALGIRDFKIDLPMIAGFLTVIGYSLNDTIVVFDRIRENRGKATVLTPDIINRSINQTLSRTLLTSFTTLIVLVVMYIWGGEGLRGFNYVLIIGVLVGTYSSIGIATPLLYGAEVGEKKSAAGTE
ncbi:MAG: protein translocase subunit SecD [Sedimentisphaerales bacterium]|nr:protein translocase subunit SecD [Sedimentisphaerales bacterium]